ncbi:MAG: bacteriochlorophyll 4-vinyl reductase [Pseudomonadota bacterium]
MTEMAHRAGGTGLIGPNAILQLVPVIELAGGRELRDQIFAAAGVFDMPSGDHMISEAPAARVHQALRAQVPDLAAALAWEAGRRTADYILAHRIPRIAQAMLKALPWRVSASLLSKAIKKNAWTFAGSGEFRVLSPYVFELAHNPIVAGEQSDTPLCYWHAAVFERLYQVLVHPHMICRETACMAQGAEACRFELDVSS